MIKKTGSFNKSALAKGATCESLGVQPPRPPASGIGLNVLDSQGKYEYNLGIKIAKHVLKQKNRSLTEKSR